MDVTPLIKSGQKIIQGYSAGRFRIGGQSYNGAVAVFPDQALLWDVPGFSGALPADYFSIFTARAQDIDVLLLGTGAAMRYEPALKKTLHECGLNIEIMDTGAACRTYNVLLGDGRRVAAALWPV